jgi:hypothetical protein
MRLRQLLLACFCVVLPLALVSSSGATVRKSGGHNPNATNQSYIFPSMGTPPPFTLFGLDHGTFDNNSGHYPKEFAMDHKLGGRWTHFNGNAIHWKNGKPNWGSLDYGIKLAREHGLAVMLSLGGEPHACSLHPTPSPIYNCPPTTTKDLNAYRSFVRQEVLRYRNVVSYYESWIEPNHTGKWPKYPNPGQYARVLETQYSVFQAVNKQYGLHLKLVFAGPNGFSNAPKAPGGMAVLPWTDQVLKALKGQRPFDAVGLHPFRFPPVAPSVKQFVNVLGIPFAAGSEGPFPSLDCGTTAARKGIWCQMNWRQELSAYEQEFTNHGYGQPDLWLTEFGSPGVAKVPAHPDPDAAYYPRYSAQKRALIEAYKVILSLPFIKAASWFNERDYTPGVPTTDPPFYAHMGLLTYKFGFKPAAYAFRHLAHEYRSR